MPDTEIIKVKQQVYIAGEVPEAWGKANRLYPQTDTGITAAIAPFLFESLKYDVLTINGISHSLIEPKQLKKLLDSSNLVHRKMKVDRVLAPGSLHTIWHNATRRFIRTLTYQAHNLLPNYEIGDKGQISALFAPLHAHENFIAQQSWITSKESLFSRENLLRANRISAALINLHRLRDGKPNFTHLGITEPSWEQIRASLYGALDKRIGEYDYPPNYLHGFIDLLVPGNATLSASLGIT